MIQHKILIMGAGKIGVTVASLLSRTGDYISYLADVSKPKDLPIINNNPINYIALDIKKSDEIKSFITLNNIDAIVSCLPYNLTITVAKIAYECNIHYFDPTEDVATTNMVMELAKNSKATFVPQCGLAPGFISIAANSLTKGFDEIEHVKMRVGALAQNTNNTLQYALTWSIDGLINEYIHPSIVIENGKKTIAKSLSGLESLNIANETFEAFHTSGGVGSLVDSYVSKVKNMDYKTIRYPGHCNKISFLLDDLKLSDNPELVKQILSRILPHSNDDKVIVYVAVQGYCDSKLVETSYINVLYPEIIDGKTFTAIQMTTASGICTMIDKVLHEKQLFGLVKQEDLSLQSFLNNRFGKYYLGDGNHVNTGLDESMKVFASNNSNNDYYLQAVSNNH